MRNHIVLTLTGPDRIGIVDQVTHIILNHEGNVEASKMAHLGGEFAMLMLIAVPASTFDKMQDQLATLMQQGFQITLRKTERDDAQKYNGWLPYQVKIHGADHEGIIHHITHKLAQQGINIESLDTNMIPAPMSGTPLFTMSAIIVVPPQLPTRQWKTILDGLCNELNVNNEVIPYTG
ncbi:MAG TPA: ACT domain-containing protein [bacterium]|nr:ACT domain-containing protein [bacterium]HPN45911.1 ACT domain-containing protein [bacterium]